MKKAGFAPRLVVIALALSLTALVVAGCGNKKESTSTNSSGGATAAASTSGGGEAAAGATKQFESGQTVGKAKKVVVDSNEEMSAEQQAVIARIGEFGDATADHNYKKLCNDLLSKQARKIGGDCVRTFSQTGAQIKDFKITVKSVSVDKDGKSASAMVDVTSNTGGAKQSQKLTLIKEGGKWRIQILGQ